MGIQSFSGKLGILAWMRSVPRKARKRKPFQRGLCVETLEDRRLLATLELAMLSAAQGTRISSPDTGDSSGYSVSMAGDVNGDGFDDLIIGAHRANGPNELRPDAGESYVVFGSSSLPAAIDLSNLGTGGIVIFGAGAADQSGRSVSDAGDVNGDGFDDLLVGAEAAGVGGASYLIYGGASLPATIDLATLGAEGVTFWGVDNADLTGESVSSAGDVNADGFADLIIGAPLAERTGIVNDNMGVSYLIFGSNALPSTIDLVNIGGLGITIVGNDLRDQSGESVSSAGDVNGDGFDDLIIGANYANWTNDTGIAGGGESYLIFGKASMSGLIDLGNLGATGVTLYTSASRRSGESVSSAGDINGDGFDDLIIGARQGVGIGSTLSAGNSFVVFGQSTLPSTINLDTTSTDFIKISGFQRDDETGRSVSGAGDVNGDGFDDLLIGSRDADGINNDQSSAGESYLVYGGPSLPGVVDLGNLGSGGITLVGGATRDYAGTSVSGAGDVNGDGFDDLIIGAYGADAGGTLFDRNGESYVVFGGNFSGSVTHLGTAAGESLNGTAAADAMVGGRGDDTLIGNGSNDLIIGGQGADVLAVSDLGFNRILGGNGHDTLRLDGSGFLLDLTTKRDNRISGIEAIDLTGTGNNAVTITPRELLNLSDESNTLIVRGNAGDSVRIGFLWNQQVDQTIGSEIFSVYRSGNATLKVLKPEVGVLFVNSTVTNRRVFYNRSTSSVFGNGSGNPSSAIDSTKIALLPGQTTTTANYTNYVRGLNGFVVDLADLLDEPTYADFQFATWDGMAVEGFTELDAIPTITLLPAAGLAGVNRVKIEFANNLIRNEWLRITMLATATTGLAANDVFYFGNAVADVYAGNAGSPVTVRTNATDTSLIRQNQSTTANSVGITNHYDLNKDGRVNANDTSFARQNQSAGIIRYFTAPANLQLGDTRLVSPSSGLRFPSMANAVGIAAWPLNDDESQSVANTAFAERSTTPISFGEAVELRPVDNRWLSIVRTEQADKDWSSAITIEDVDRFFSDYDLSSSTMRRARC